MTSAVARRPRPVLCVTEHEHRGRAVADGVRAGRFTRRGRDARARHRPRLARRATCPPTRSGGSSGSSSRWGLDLAHAAAETGDPGYQRAWERLTASWIRPGAGRTPTPPRSPRAGSSTGSTPGSGFDAATQDHAGAAARAASPSRSRTSARTSRPSATTARSSCTRCSSPALALPELDRDGLLDLAVAELDRNLATDFRPDGVHREASTHYHVIALRSFVGARENAAPLRARAAGRASTSGSPARCAFAVHCTRPDGTIPALSDADTRRLRAAAASRPPSCSATRSCATSARAAAPAARPRRRHVSFPDGGYFVQRSGWDPERALPDLRLRPARRRRPRPLRPAERRGARRRPAAGRRPGPRHLLRGAAEPAPLVPRHGRAQHGLRRRARPDALHAAAARAGPVARGRFLGRGTRPGSTCSPARRAARPTRPCTSAGSRSSATATGSSRTACEGEREHRYDLRFHLAPEAQGAARVDGATRARARPRARDPRRRAGRARARLGRAELRRAARRAGRQRDRARDERALRHAARAARAGRAGAAAGARRGRAPAGRDRRRARHDRPARDRAASGSARACEWRWSSA